MSEWVLTAVFMGRRVRFGCLGNAGGAQHAAITPGRPEDHGVEAPADLAGVFRDLVLLKPVKGIVWKDPVQFILRFRKWIVRWIERRGGRIERFELPAEAEGHGSASKVSGLRLIVPSDEIEESIRRLKRVARIIARDERGGL